MASVRTRDPDALCYTTQSMWACYEFTIPKPEAFPANYTQKMLQPQIADKVTALQKMINIQTGGWDLESIESWTRLHPNYIGWKPFNIARSGQSGRPSDINPFYGYNYETFGFTTLLAKMLGRSFGSWSIFFEPDDGIDKKDETQIKKDYKSVSDFAYTQSRLINFATYAGAKMFCEEEDGATTCEIDNTGSIPRRMMSGDGRLYYPYGAKHGYKIIVSTWVDEYGDLSVRWARSYPIYSNSAAFKLIASG
jgi:hypothetical protein